MKVVPANNFKEHKIQPQPGLQVDIDGEMGVITRVSGGRVIVNFNHPLSGREVKYSFKVNRKINDEKEKVSSFLSMLMRIPKDKIQVELDGDKAVVKLPAELPVQITTIFVQKLIELTNLKDIVFQKA